jgi:hypothetical protein
MKAFKVRSRAEGSPGSSNLPSGDSPFLIKGVRQIYEQVCASGSLDN